MLERIFKEECVIKRPVTVGQQRTKGGKYNLDGGTPAKIKSMSITEHEMTVFNLTANNSAFLIKGLDTIPEGSELEYNDKTYDLDKIKQLKNIWDKHEGFKVFV